MIQIVGAGGHGRDIASICKACGVDYVLTDDDEGEPSAMPWTVIGVNAPQVRARMAERFPFAATVVDPRAIVRDSELSGCVIAAGAVVLDSALGPHVHVNYNASMTRTRVGACSTIAPGVTICGDVTIGERVFIGAGAVVVNLVTIGDDAFIEAGARVTRDVPAGARVKGGNGECSSVRQ